MKNRLRRLAPLAAILFVFAALAGCGPERAAAERDPAGGSAAENSYTPPENLRPPPEPAGAPPLDREPAGTVVGLGSSPEGIVADPETRLVAVASESPTGSR